MDNRKQIAQTEEWRAYVVPDGSVIELERVDTDRRFMIPSQDIHNLWRLMGKVNGYLQAVKPAELAHDSSSEDG